MMEIEGAVMLVTGASSGIGEATARAAHQAGARVVLLARREDRIQKIAKELGNAVALPCDVTNSAEVLRAVQSAVDICGPIDVLVNNAGQGLDAGIEHIRIDDFRELFDLNIVAPLAMMQAVIPIMRKQGAGSIVNVSSGATFGALPGSAAYTSSKSALNMLSNVARVEPADVGIVVSTVYPFITATEFYGSVKAGLQSARQQVAGTASVAHRPEQVAEMILGLIESGAAQADLVPEQYGGSFKG